MDPYELLERAQDCLDQFPPQVEMAAKFYAKAVQMQPDNTDCIDSFGEFETEYGDPATAKELFLRSAQLAPGENSAKFFFLGQLSAGEEGVQFYREGLRIQAEEPVESAEERKAVAEKAASAHASIAEFYMTDLCDAPGAQQACEQALESALRAVPGHFEASVVLATLRKTLGQFDEALRICETCVEQVEDLGECDLDERPGRDSRIQLAETLIDLKGEKHALTLLHDLLEEDEEDVKTWYLLACAHHGDEDDDAADECLEKALHYSQALGPECAAEWAPRLQCLQDGLCVAVEED